MVARTVTDDDPSSNSVSIELTAENLPHALRDLLRLWRERVQAKWRADGTRPTRELAQLHTVTHAAAVGTFVEDREMLDGLHRQSERYFNAPHVASSVPQDDTWFHTRARAVDVLIAAVAGELTAAENAGRLKIDDPEDLLKVATELVLVVVDRLSAGIEVSLEVLADLPTDFSAPHRLADAAQRAHASVVAKVSLGHPAAAIPVLDGIMEGLGHSSPANLTSAARKALAKAAKAGDAVAGSAGKSETVQPKSK